MNDGTQDQVEVSFPASPIFSRIAKVAVVGLALRLGVGVSPVEQLRTAVDQAVGYLHGEGRITLKAQWEPHQLSIAMHNPDIELDSDRQTQVIGDLSSLVDEVKVDSGSIRIILASLQ